MILYMILFMQKGMMVLKIQLSKQARKYIASVDERTRRKLYNALDELSEFKGDIRKLQGYKNTYRYKIEHYRIIFKWEKGEIVIQVIEINTRTNIKY